MIELFLTILKVGGQWLPYLKIHIDMFAAIAPLEQFFQSQYKSLSLENLEMCVLIVNLIVVQAELEGFVSVSVRDHGTHHTKEFFEYSSIIMVSWSMKSKDSLS